MFTYKGKGKQMLKIVNKKSSNKYNGSKVVNDDDVKKIEQVFDSKFQAFCYGVEQNWSKKCIMKYCLGTERDQYFYNYLLKYNANNSK